MYIGMIDLMERQYAQAAATFSRGEEEFARTADGPWFAVLASAARDLGERAAEPGRRDRGSGTAAERLRSTPAPEGVGVDRSAESLVDGSEWGAHLKWLLRVR